MEADWAVALAADDPVIVVPWAALPEDAKSCRFVDLRTDLSGVDDIEEARATPALRAALVLLNERSSQFWTAKCDVWITGEGEGADPIDGYEMDAEAADTAFGAGSYIDLVPRSAAALASFAMQERWMRTVVQRLRSAPLRAARVDLVLRPALVEKAPGFAITWSVEGCGATAQLAQQKWFEALREALAILASTGW